MKILLGKAIAKRVLFALTKKNAQSAIKPTLAAIMVGNDPASLLYLKIKEKTCQKIGIRFKRYDFVESISERKVIDLINQLNRDNSISGIIVQLPLPKRLNTNKIISAISPLKDVDGLHPLNLGKLLIGEKTFIPPTPAAILAILQNHDISLKGKHLVIVGYGKLVGKPLAAMLTATQSDATVTICNKDTKNLAFYTKQADILISATGVPHLIKDDMVKKGAVVIDAGTTIIKRKTKNEKRKTKIMGDVDFDQVKKKASAITPAIGGIGPLTVAKLLENVVKLQ